MTQREIQIEKIKRLEEALIKTKSKYLKRDYEKAIKKLKRDLMYYNKKHHESTRLEKKNNKSDARSRDLSGVF